MLQKIRMSNCDLTDSKNSINKSHIPSLTAHHLCAQNQIDGLLVEPLMTAYLACNSSPTSVSSLRETRRSTWLICLLLFGAFLLLAGCGPEASSSSQQALMSETERIALEYQSAHNLAQARAQLDALEVANINQWLIYTTEEVLTRGDSGEMVDSLVVLVMDLGLPSNSIRNYAIQHNLVAVVEVEPTPVTVPVVVAANTPVANVNMVPAPVTAQTATTLTTLITGPALSSTISATTPVVDAGAALTTSKTLSSTALLSPSLAATPVTAVATATPASQPIVKASSDINVRAGPGVEYALAGALRTGEAAQVLGKNPLGDWWEVALASGSNGWVYSQLVESSGDLSSVAVALNIPTPPPTPLPVPTEVPAPTTAPAAAPVAAATATPAPAAPSGGPDFRVVEKRLWDVVENGGQLNGISVTCGEKRQLVVNVLDAAGNRLDGVAVQEIYGAQEVFVSGNQGKGSGVVEFVLGGGQALKVIRDSDGREVTSEEVYGMSTKPWEIPYETLIGGRFCTDDASCKSFVDQTGCYGHYSWTVTFQRSY